MYHESESPRLPTDQDIRLAAALELAAAMSALASGGLAIAQASEFLSAVAPAVAVGAGPVENSVALAFGSAGDAARFARVVAAIRESARQGAAPGPAPQA